MKKILTLMPLALLAACATDVPFREMVPAPEGSAVPIGKAVEVASLALEPLEVTEDSRCPINARCIWAGRLTVRTAIATYGWTETRDMTLGEPIEVRGYSLALTSGEPDRMAGDDPIEPVDYRFTYEGWPTDSPPE